MFLGQLSRKFTSTFSFPLKNVYQENEKEIEKAQVVIYKTR